MRQVIKLLSSYLVLFNERTECINVERRARRHKGVVTLADFPSRDSKVVNPTSRLVIDEHIAHQGAILVCEVRKPPVELCSILVKGQRKRLGYRKILRCRHLGIVRVIPLTGFGLGIQLPTQLSLISRCNNAICTISIYEGRPRISCINILLILGKLKVQAFERFYGRIKGGVFVFKLSEHRISRVFFAIAHRELARHPSAKEQTERGLVYGQTLSMQPQDSFVSEPVNRPDMLE